MTKWGGPYLNMHVAPFPDKNDSLNYKLKD